MAEEIKYIPYGTDQIDYNQFLQNSANEVQNYVNQQPWSRKRKESFLNAYKQLMAQGITGASNDTGIWRINYNGEQIDLDSKSKIDREMFGEAAYFIQQQMGGLKPKQKEQEENKNKSIFDNQYFTSSFHNQISKDLYGGRGLYTSEWNKQDARGEDGLLNIDNRADQLAKQLRKYADSLKEEDLDFKDSPFENLADFKTRIESAITALNSKNPDAIRESLNRLGLNYDNYFYNGSEDSFKTDGYEGTYGDYYGNYLPKQQKEKQQVEETKQKTAWNNGYKYMKFYGQGLFGKPLSSEKSNLDYLNQLATKDNLNGDEQSELVGAFKLAAKNGALQDLSKEELAKFGPFGSAYTSRPGRLKKINGLNGLYWDTLGNRVIKPFVDKNNATSNFQNILDQNNPNKVAANQKEQQALEQQKYLANTELTDDQWRELAGIAADVASVIDPEPFTAGGLALAGTGLRTYNRAFDPDGFTLSDAGHTTLDLGLSLLGMIPVVGDASLTARAISTLQKGAGWLGALFAAASVPPAAKAAWELITQGKNPSIEGWRAIGNVLMGATQARRIQLNRAAGNAVKNQNKPTTTKEKVGEVEVKINGKTEKVEIDEASAKELQQAYKAAGNNQEATTKALRENSKVREQLEAKKTSDGKPAYTKEQIDAIEAPQAASGSLRGKSPVKGLRDTRGVKIIDKTIETVNPSTSELELGPLAELRLNAMRRNIGWFNRGNYGWNMRTKGEESSSNSWLKNMWEKAKNPYTQQKPKSKSEITESSIKPNTEKSSTEKPKNVTKEDVSNMKRGISRAFRNSNPESNTSMEIKSGEIVIGNKTFKVKEKDASSKNKEKIDGIRKNFKSQVEQQLSSSKLTREQLKKIKEELIKAKKLGWWKQGGTIEPSIDTIIENFLNK